MSEVDGKYVQNIDLLIRAYKHVFEDKPYREQVSFDHGRTFRFDMSALPPTETMTNARKSIEERIAAEFGSCVPYSVLCLRADGTQGTIWYRVEMPGGIADAARHLRIAAEILVARRRVTRNPDREKQPSEEIEALLLPKISELRATLELLSAVELGTPK